MVSYGSNLEVQNLAFGASDSNQDTRCTSVRDVVTSWINARFHYETDLTTVPDVITRATNLMSAGMILTGQMQVDANVHHPFVELALKLLAEIGEETTGGEWGEILSVERF
jgi:hypothetical protein